MSIVSRANRPAKETATIKSYAALRKAMTSGGARAGIVVSRTGLPATVLVSLAEHYDISLKQAYRLVGVAPATADRRMRQQQNLTQEASERLTRIAQIEGDAIDVLGDEATAKRWLEAPNAALGGEAPLSMIDTGHGTEAVRRLLGSIRYGGAA